MKYPLVSIIIATYNSKKTLAKVFESIRKQDYSQKKIEVLVIDGGSQDSTLEIAKRYKYKVYKNYKVDQVYAKHLGYLKAKGRYLLLLDSDEVIQNSNSIKLKVETMLKDKLVKAVISSGYRKPVSYPDINSYLNEFGDPFSYFMYRNSKDPKFFLKELKSKYKVISEDKNQVTFDFSKAHNLPFIELTSMGVLIDLKYIKSSLPVVLRNVATHTHLFYLLNREKQLFSVMKHDQVIHYSAANLTGYLKKISSRIKSNIFGTAMGKAGFKGREVYDSFWPRLKKYLFVPYTLSIILPVVDSIFMFITRRKLIYFIHTLLCIYTLLLIMVYYLVRVFKIRTKLYGYGT